MNDTEIIKALECCSMPHTEVKCYCCKSTNVDICSKLNPTIILDLIKRQQAEIEKLKKVKHGHWVKCGYKWQCTHCQSLINIDGTPEENLLNHCPNCGAKMTGGE